jgi:GNAT superfamily N-acetyltransferase
VSILQNEDLFIGVVTMQIAIKNLLDCQEHQASLAELWYQEISRHWVADASVDRAMTNLSRHLNRDQMPLALIALDGSKLAGMACLRETDGIKPGVTPWLGSLVVDPAYRNKGVGQLLIDAVKAQAKNLGHDTLYLLAFDPTIPGWYASLDWQHIGYDELFGHRVTVMSIQL